MALVPRGYGAEIGDLYLLPVSPWSIRVLLVLRHVRVPVNVLAYKGPLSEFEIWVRMRFSKRRVTAPVFFPRGGGDVVMDSHEIARLLDSLRASDAATLFPPAYDDTIRELVECAETISFHGRDLTSREMLENVGLAKPLILPRWMCSLPFTDLLVRFFVRQFRSKYAPESARGSEKNTRSALTTVREAINASSCVGFRFLAGNSLSFADIAVGLSLNIFSKKKISPFAFGDHSELAKEFVDVKQWGDDFLGKYCSPDFVAFPPPLYDADGNTVVTQ